MVADPATAPPGALVKMLRASGAVRFGEFTLASGARSDVYVDIKRAWTDPKRLGLMATHLAGRVGDAERLAGMELGAVPLLVATSLTTGLPIAVVRKAPKGHGTNQRIEGEIVPGERVVVVEDVTTTGGSVEETVRLLRAAGAKVERVLAVVDREEGAGARLSAIGVELLALATLREIREAGS